MLLVVELELVLVLVQDCVLLHDLVHMDLGHDLLHSLVRVQHPRHQVVVHTLQTLHQLLQNQALQMVPHLCTERFINYTS